MEEIQRLYENSKDQSFFFKNIKKKVDELQKIREIKSEELQFKMKL